MPDELVTAAGAFGIGGLLVAIVQALAGRRLRDAEIGAVGAEAVRTWLDASGVSLNECKDRLDEANKRIASLEAQVADLLVEFRGVMCRRTLQLEAMEQSNRRLEAQLAAIMDKPD